MKTGHRPVQVARSVVETAADPAGESVEIEVLAAPATGRALEPRPSLLIPDYRIAGSFEKFLDLWIAGACFRDCNVTNITSTRQRKVRPAGV